MLSPRAIPSGVMQEKKTISPAVWPRGALCRTKLTESAKLAVALWATIATKIRNVLARDSCTPSAMPAKIECTESAAISA